MVAMADAPSRNESSGSSTLMRTGKRAARRIQSSERSTRGKPPTLVPFSGSTAQPSPTTVPRYVAELRLAEVRHHVPGARVDEREDLRPGAGKGAQGDVQVDDPSAEGRPQAGVAEIQLRRVHRCLRG